MLLLAVVLLVLLLLLLLLLLRLGVAGVADAAARSGGTLPALPLPTEAIFKRVDLRAQFRLALLLPLPIVQHRATAPS